MVSTALLRAAETPIPDSPTGWVTDTTHFLSPDAARSLDARLSGYQQTSGHQLLIYIGPSTGGEPIEDWAVRAFKQWKVGRKGLDDGLVLFIMSQDRKLRIEVGYGLEALVPDAIASRVIREVMAPRIQRGDTDGAVIAAIDALTGVIEGNADSLAKPPGQLRPTGVLPGQAKPDAAKSLTLTQWIVYSIVGVLFLVFAVTHPSLAFFFLSSILSGGGREGGGGGFGGGGFGGGGGRSGGGGASGSW